MKRSMTFATLWLVCMTMSSCTGRTSGQTAPTPKAETTETVPQHTPDGEEPFPFPDIPEVMTNPDERRSYLLQHYWDRYDFADTTLLHRAGVTEQGLVNYVALVGTHPDRAEADGAVNGFCRKMAAGEQSRQVFASLLEKYLYDPMSPLRDDALYVRFLDRLLAHAPKEEPLCDRWSFLRELAGRNNPGEAATDFTYYLPDGRKQTLYGTPGGQTLLFFYDPECENCHTTLLEMKASAPLAEAVRAGQVTVLAVYTEGNPDVWRREAIKTQALYDLKAMPTLYLLDAEKRVVRKDVAFGQLAIDN